MVLAVYLWLRVDFVDGHDAGAFAAVDGDGEGVREADGADVSVVVECFHCIEAGDIVAGGGLFGADGEVADAEAGEVVEEVGALAGLDVVVRQGCFHNEARGCDVGPVDGDAEGGVG